MRLELQKNGLKWKGVSELRIENGELRIENGELRMENGEWRIKGVPENRRFFGVRERIEV